ncbi:MAG: hypothetical protein AAGH74_13050 [Pseudomonadota bacterium]
MSIFLRTLDSVRWFRTRLQKEPTAFNDRQNAWREDPVEAWREASQRIQSADPRLEIDLRALQQLPLAIRGSSAWDLSLDCTSLDDLSSLRHMPNLSSLSLRNLNMNAAASLSKLSLESLLVNFQDGVSVDLSFLSRLKTNGLLLFADDTDIQSLEYFGDSGRLESLLVSANRTKIQSLEPLRNQTSLWELNIDDTNVSSLSPIAGCRELKEVRIRNTKIQFIEALQNAEKLVFLGLSGCPGLEIEPIAKLIALEQLDANNCGVLDLSPIERLQKLHNLQLRDNNIASIEALRGLEQLTWLDLGNNPLADISPLERLHALRALLLDGTLVEDLRALRGMPWSEGSTPDDPIILHIENTPVAERVYPEIAEVDFLDRASWVWRKLNAH